MACFQPNEKDQSKAWSIVSDGTKAEELWNLLRLLNLDAPQLFSRPPKKIPIFSSSIKIFCYICVGSGNVTIIRRSAEYIRSRIDYPFALVCLDFDPSTKKYLNSSFLHTPDGELYRDNGEDLKLIPLDPSELRLERMVLESSKTALWSGPLPSEVTDQEYLYLPSTEEGMANMANENGGKWMIFTSRSNMARHDDFFLAMVSLYRKGIFVGLKVATAMANSGGKLQMLVDPKVRREGLLIFCYTANSEDRGDVLRAAKAIRSVIENDSIIYYKTNSASIKGKYTHEGKWHVTKYMHTVGGGFYERDNLSRFKLFIPSTNSKQ